MPKRKGQVGQRERPAWETQIAKLDGKVELVVNPAMLADKMKIIRAQSVLSNTFTDVRLAEQITLPVERATITQARQVRSIRSQEGQ